MVLPGTLIYGSLLLGLVAAAIVVGSDSKQMSGIKNLFTGQDKLARFQRLYLPGFLLAMLADWLQGPFVYALYQGYGIDREHNGYLFVGGFGASAIFGTIRTSRERSDVLLLSAWTSAAPCASARRSIPDIEDRFRLPL